MTVVTKVCSRCNLLTEVKLTRKGHGGVCRSCKAEKQREYREKKGKSCTKKHEKVKKEPELKLETHCMSIPYGFTVFGRMFELPLECVFGYSGDLKTSHVLELTSLTGTDADGLTWDMMYLVEDSESILTKHIIACILNNSSNWDVEPAKGVWWDNENMGVSD
jgi:hypothetical protein